LGKGRVNTRAGNWAALRHKCVLWKVGRGIDIFGFVFPFASASLCVALFISCLYSGQYEKREE
jgi:hypothetical protein